VFIASFPAGPWQTNCYVVASEPGAECLVLDPGADAAPGVRDVVAEHRLKPVAVILTHGHLDHMMSVTPLCGSYDATCWVHTADRVLLADPYRAMGPEVRRLVQQLTGGSGDFAEPDEVRELVDGATVRVAGVELTARHAPGHTPGSTMFLTDYDDDPAVQGVLFAGDVLFAGSIGRTDLPGGDPAAMRASLRRQVLTLPDATAVLPGHGPQTTIGRERSGNPFLQEASLAVD
jgi:hydroxyacylglutathione hydrolase